MYALYLNNSAMWIYLYVIALYRGLYVILPANCNWQSLSVKLSNNN